MCYHQLITILLIALLSMFRNHCWNCIRCILYRIICVPWHIHLGLCESMPKIQGVEIINYSINASWRMISGNSGGSLSIEFSLARQAQGRVITESCRERGDPSEHGVALGAWHSSSRRQGCRSAPATRVLCWLCWFVGFCIFVSNGFLHSQKLQLVKVYVAK